MKNFITFWCLFVATLTLAQPNPGWYPQPEWMGAEPVGVLTDNNGFTLWVDATDSTTLIRYDNSGNLVWKRKGNEIDVFRNDELYEMNKSDVFASLATAQGSLLAYKALNTTDSSYFPVVELRNEAGDLVWIQQYSALKNTTIRELIALSNGGFAALTITDSASPVPGINYPYEQMNSASVLNLSSSGSINWMNTWEGSWIQDAVKGAFDGAINELSNGNIQLHLKVLESDCCWVDCECKCPSDFYWYFRLNNYNTEFSPDGVPVNETTNIVWSSELGGDLKRITSVTMANGAQETIDYFPESCVFSSMGQLRPVAKAALLSYNTDGTIANSQNLPIYDYQRIIEPVFVPNTAIYVSGTRQDYDFSSEETVGLNTLVSKLSSNGDSLWQKQFSFTESSGSLFECRPKFNTWLPAGALLVYHLVKTNQGNYPGLLVVSPQGCADPACADSTGFVPAQEVIAQNFTLYPNPANTQVQLTFAEPVLSGVLVLYTADGKIVQQLEIAHATQQQLFDISTLPVGVYFCRFQSITGASSVSKLLIER